MMRLRRFLRDRAGVSAVEFAFIAPVLILAYFGVAELCGAMLAERKTSHVAYAIGDLTAQASVIHDSDVTNIFNIGAIIMSPDTSTGLKMRITSIQKDSTGAATVGWCAPSGLTCPANGSAVGNLPANLIGNSQSIIRSEAQYTYTVPVAYMLPTSFPFSYTFYLRPRIVDPIVRTSP